MRRPPIAVVANYPDPAGVPLPQGVSGLRLLLTSPDPAAIHDAFLASAAAGRNGSVECWLDPGYADAPAGSDGAGAAAAGDRLVALGRGSMGTVGGGGGSLPPLALPHPHGAHGAGPDGYALPPSSAAHAIESAVTLAANQLHEWARQLGVSQPGGNLSLAVRSLLSPPPPASPRSPLPDPAFDVAACIGLPCRRPEELAVALQNLYGMLAAGGELFLTALLCDRRLGPDPDAAADALEVAGVGPAPYFEDFIKAMRGAGFTQPRVLRVEPWDAAGADEEAGYLLAGSKLSTFTIRAQKNRLLEASCEDYGQWAVYRGTIEGSEESYALDMHHKLARDTPAMVCGNTAAMLGEEGVSWLAAHFAVSGDRTVHYGTFSGHAPGARPERCCM